MAQPDLWIAPDLPLRLQLPPKPSRSATSSPWPALVDLAPPPPEIEQLAAIAKELSRFSN